MAGLWDRGTWQPLHGMEEELAQGRRQFTRGGVRMRAGWALVRML